MSSEKNIGLLRPTVIFYVCVVFEHSCKLKGFHSNTLTMGSANSTHINNNVLEMAKCIVLILVHCALCIERSLNNLNYPSQSPYFLDIYVFFNFLYPFYNLKISRYNTYMLYTCIPHYTRYKQ